MIQTMGFPSNFDLSNSFLSTFPAMMWAKTERLTTEISCARRSKHGWVLKAILSGGQADYNRIISIIVFILFFVAQLIHADLSRRGRYALSNLNRGALRLFKLNGTEGSYYKDLVYEHALPCLTIVQHRLSSDIPIARKIFKKKVKCIPAFTILQSGLHYVLETISLLLTYLTSDFDFITCSFAQIIADYFT